MPRLYTIGHSNHTLKEFITILKAHGVTDVIDISSVPKSRHVPWVNKNELDRSLAWVDIGYTHMSNLGGL